MLNGKYPRILLWSAGIALLFFGYTSGLSHNPPGFYVDESAIAYNAYLVSRAGAREFGPHFPLYFQMFTEGFTQYVSPTQVYLLALVFRFVPPSILVARTFSAFWVFAACLLLGLLAKRISGRLTIGLIVAVTALLTPWFFDIRGLVFEPHVVPFAVTVFLVAVWYAQTKENWNWRIIAGLVGTLALLTYCYTSGRVLGGLLAVGLLLFATTKRRLIAVIIVWLCYALTLIPIFVFNRQHPEALLRRLYEISYIRPGVPWRDIASEFVRRYLEDQSLYPLLLLGDHHPRHHVQGSGGAIFFATFILAMIGLFFVLARGWREPWWRFVLYGLAVSVVPGAITDWPFHQLRLMSYAVFLLLLTVPALEWLLAPEARKMSRRPSSAEISSNQSSQSLVPAGGVSCWVRLGILFLLLAGTVIQAVRYQTILRRDGPKREFEFDVPYKAAYDAAVAQPSRPIYLQDGKWGPCYIDAMWYATIEGRPKSEFVHLPDRGRSPHGSIVISSADNCQNCQIIKRSGVYLLYRAK
jgi:4-amino-4-deoxy-L-arabinose transferase-like glycosyltransferase